MEAAVRMLAFIHDPLPGNCDMCIREHRVEMEEARCKRAARPVLLLRLEMIGGFLGQHSELGLQNCGNVPWHCEDTRSKRPWSVLRLSRRAGIRIRGGNRPWRGAGRRGAKSPPCVQSTAGRKYFVDTQKRVLIFTSAPFSRYNSL